MKMTILAIGRMKAGPEKELCDDYLTRAKATGRSCGITALDVREFPESGLDEPDRRREAEAKALAASLKPGGFHVVLDETGRALKSADFAALLRREIEGGASEIAFLIGGPDGHAQSIRQIGQFHAVSGSDDLAAPTGAGDARRTDLPGSHDYG